MTPSFPPVLNQRFEKIERQLRLILYIFPPFLSGILSKLSPISYCCGWHKFINPSYVFFCLSNFILYAWYDVMYVYLVDYSEKDLVSIS